jgi:hypothetical protein
MARLETRINLSAHDELYEQLTRLHAGLSDEQCHRVDARLILLLANHIGDPEAIAEALVRARGNDM